MYEVKRVGLSHDEAIIQLTHYVSSKLIGLHKLLGDDVDIPDMVLRPGTNALIRGEFIFEEYAVSYWFAGDGIIEYDYKELSEQPDSQTVPIRKKQRHRDLVESINWRKALGAACLSLLAGGAMGAMVICLSDESHMY